MDGREAYVVLGRGCTTCLSLPSFVGDKRKIFAGLIATRPSILNWTTLPIGIPKARKGTIRVAKLVIF